jgi:hypothetical protein
MGADELSEAAAQGQKFLAELQGKASEAVLCYDGYVTLGDVRMDAIFVEIRSFDRPGFEATMAVPYQPAKDQQPFKVFRPKFVKIPDGADPEALAQAFFDGVDAHKQGSEVWNKHIDQSR